VTARVIELTDAPIDIDRVRSAVNDDGFGAILIFEGVGRNHFEGRPVVALEYEAYADMAVPEMARIADEVEQKWQGKLSMIHRTGRVEIGEPSVVIAVGTPHRGACYEASRYAIDELKKRVPVWKKEVYADGSAWKANAPA